MASHTWLERREIAIGGVILTTGITLLLSPYDGSSGLSLAGICRWAILILLAQGLLRDLAIMLTDRRRSGTPRIL